MLTFTKYISEQKSPDSPDETHDFLSKLPVDQIKDLASHKDTPFHALVSLSNFEYKNPNMSHDEVKSHNRDIRLRLASNPNSYKNEEAEHPTDVAENLLMNKKTGTLKGNHASTFHAIASKLAPAKGKAGRVFRTLQDHPNEAARMAAALHNEKSASNLKNDPSNNVRDSANIHSNIEDLEGRIPSLHWRVAKEVAQRTNNHDTIDELMYHEHPQVRKGVLHNKKIGIERSGNLVYDSDRFVSKQAGHVSRKLEAKRETNRFKIK